MANTFEFLQKITLSATNSTAGFTAIPQTYNHLKVLASVRTDRAGEFTDYIQLKPNNVSTNLTSIFEYFSGTTRGASTAADVYGAVPGATAATATFGFAEFDILDYSASTSKTIMLHAATENTTSSNYAHIVSGLWTNSSPITSLYFASLNGANWVANSNFYLYGIKNT